MFTSKRIVALGLLALAMSVANMAQAITPANTQLAATATLTYTGNSTGITAAVTVTVSLVKANVTITPAYSVPADQTKAENQAFSATYWVYAQNNGEATYNLSTTINTNNNVTSPGSFSTDTASITLGASALSAVSAAGLTISVPSDGVADSTVNGLSAGDTVVINDVIYTIATGGVTDPGGSGTATITLNTAVPASLPIGTGVFEAQSFTVSTTDVGSVGGASPSLTIRTSVSDGVDAAFTDDIVITIVQISIAKYVGCGSSPSNCDDTSGSGSLQYDETNNTTGATGPLYYTSGVTAKPGGTLEYLIVMSNPTATAISGAILSDVLPNFTSYVASSTLLNSHAVTDDSTVSASAPLNHFPLDSSGTGGGLSVGANSSFTGEDDGVIPGSTTIYVVYKVTVAN